LRSELGELFTTPALWALGVLNATGFLFQNLALLHTTAINVSLLVNVNVVVVAVFSVVYLRDRLGPGGVLGILLGAGGIVLLTTEGDPEVVREGSFMGDMYALAAGLVWSGYIVLTKLTLDGRVRYSPSLGTDPLGLTAGISTTTGAALVVPCLAYWWYSGEGLDAPAAALAMPGPLHLAYLGIFSVVVAFYFWHRGLKALPAWASSLVLLCEVMFAAALSMLWLGEVLGPTEGLGGLLILAGIILAERGLRELPPEA
jgi:drug/metabolite transporter (DMT)-like permease